jgi:hypothetical protein
MQMTLGAQFQQKKASIANLAPYLLPYFNNGPAASTVKNENGFEVSYDFAITPAIRLIPSYQHIWNPMAAGVAKNEHGANVFLLCSSLTW